MVHTKQESVSMVTHFLSKLYLPRQTVLDFCIYTGQVAKACLLAHKHFKLFNWKSARFLSLRKNAFYFKIFCASRDPHWFQNGRDERDLESGEKVPLKIGQGEVSTNRCVLSTAPIRCCADDPNIHSVLVEIFWQLGFVFFKKNSYHALYVAIKKCLSSRMWCKSVAISQVWWSWFSYKTVNDCTFSSGNEMPHNSVVCKRITNLIPLWLAVLRNNPERIQWSRCQGRECDDGHLWIVWCLIDLADQESVLLESKSYIVWLIQARFDRFRYSNSSRSLSNEAIIAVEVGRKAGSEDVEFGELVARKSVLFSQYNALNIFILSTDVKKPHIEERSHFIRFFMASK